MCTSNTFKIDLHQMDEAPVHRSYALTDDFFDRFESEDIRGGRLSAEVQIRRMASGYGVTMSVKGNVRIPCDLCLDDMDHQIDIDEHLQVRLGDEASDQDEVMVIPASDPVLDISWLIYEFVVLSLPIRHVHDPKDCDPVMLSRLGGAEQDSTDQSERDGDEGGALQAELERIKNKLNIK